jgi:hypothetical protein
LIVVLQIQAKYTDCLLLNKHDLVTERQLDTVLDHLYELNDETPMIRVSKEHPLDPSLVFGLDTKLFARGSEEIADWKTIVADGGVGERSNHSDEIETVSVWRGGGRPGKGNTKKRDIAQVDGKTMDGGHKHHEHAVGEACACASIDAGEEDHVEVNGADEAVSPVDVEALTAGLAKLPFEIYRGTFLPLCCTVYAIPSGLIATPLGNSKRFPQNPDKRRPQQIRHSYPQLGFRSFRNHSGTILE